MIKFSAEFGNIHLTVTLSHYQGDTSTLVLSREDRGDLERKSAGVFQIQIVARIQEENLGPLEFNVPVVVLGLYEESDDEELTKEEALAEEALDLIEDAFLEKIELHLKLEGEPPDLPPPWGRGDK